MDGITTAAQRQAWPKVLAFIRPAPKSADVQLWYLVRQLKGTKAAARMLRVPQRTVERYEARLGGLGL
ncbi:hypothetical protein ACFYXM_29840 [Streptomyces sp. NPDC002476]|uniref:hypothetical protein n=1 Tax=Streptomyces sp. NPDC002476 TaxID=3364648 RepID=UPI00369BF6C5